jgi:hypothetical protein
MLMGTAESVNGPPPVGGRVTLGVGGSTGPSSELVRDAPKAPPPTAVTSACAGTARFAKTTEVKASRTSSRRLILRFEFTVRFTPLNRPDESLTFVRLEPGSFAQSMLTIVNVGGRNKPANTQSAKFVFSQHELCRFSPNPQVPTPSVCFAARGSRFQNE